MFADLLNHLFWGGFFLPKNFLSWDMNSPIIDAPALLHLLEQNRVILVDATGGKGKEPDAVFLSGAVYVDLDSDLAEIPANPSFGGRHPLPSVEAFCACLGHLGISPTSHVVVYDDKGGANAAARFWWMLRSIGHEQVQVLNGGQAAAVKAGMGLVFAPAIPKSVDDYPIPKFGWQLPLAFIDEVEALAVHGKGLVIDVREGARFRGEIEPIDKVAGHIPGAINVAISENLDARTKLFLTPEELRDKYANIFGNVPIENVAVHCGSGVTACHTLLALDYAGFDLPKLYVGSWSEWSRVKK